MNSWGLEIVFLGVFLAFVAPVFLSGLLRYLQRSLGLRGLNYSRLYQEYADVFLDLIDQNQLFWILIDSLPESLEVDFVAVYWWNGEDRSYHLKSKQSLDLGLPAILGQMEFFVPRLREYQQVLVQSRYSMFFCVLLGYCRVESQLSFFGSVAVVPLLHQQSLMGFIMVGPASKGPRRDVSFSDVRFLKSLTPDIVGGLQKSEFNTQFQQQAMDLTELNDFMARLGQSIELDQVLKESSDQLEDMFGLDLVLFYMIDIPEIPSAISFSRKIPADVQLLQFPLSSFRDAARNTQSSYVLLNEFHDSSLNLFARRLMTFFSGEFVLGYPFYRGDQLIGVAVGVGRSTLPAWDESVLVQFSKEVALSLDNSLLYSRVLRIGESLKQLFETLPAGIVLCDERLVVREINRQFEVFLGIDRVDFLGKDLSFLLDVCPALQVMVNTQETNETQAVEVALGDADSVYCSIHTGVVRQGDHEHVMAVLSDISEVRRLQDDVEQSSRLGALGTMAKGISGEIGGPISRISELVEALDSQVLDSQSCRQFQDEVVGAVDKVNMLCQSLLDFGRPKRPHLEEVAVGLVIEEACALAGVDQIYEGFEIDVDLRSQDMILADRGQMIHAVLNVIYNAFDALKNSSIRRVLVRSSRVSRGYVEISVIDEGPGMDDDVLSRALDPFFTSKVARQGIGLSVAHRIMMTHKGRIGIRSDVSQGTVVTLQVPCSEIIPEISGVF